MRTDRLLLAYCVCSSLALAQPGETAPEGTPLRPGRPEFLRQMKFFEDSSAFHYALLTDPAEDTLIFLEKATANTRPQYWLLALQAEKVTGSSEVTFRDRPGGMLAADGTLQSEAGPLKYGLRYTPQSETVWWVPDSSSGDVSLDSFASIGFRYEPSLYFGKSPGVALEPVVFSVAPMLRILHWLTLMGQVGVFTGVMSQFTGLEFGAFVLLAPLDTRWYLLAGVTDYDLAGNDHNGGSILNIGRGYIALGAGFQPSPSLTVDLSLLYPRDGGVYGYNRDFFAGPGGSTIVTRLSVDTIVKLGICWHTPFSD